MRSLLKEAEPDVAKMAKEVASWVYYHLEQMHLELAVRRRLRLVRFACLDSRPSAHEASTSEHTRVFAAACLMLPHADFPVKTALLSPVPVVTHPSPCLASLHLLTVSRLDWRSVQVR